MHRAYDPIRAGVWILFIAAALSCDGGGDATPTPAAQCERLVTSVCNRSVECAGNPMVDDVAERKTCFDALVVGAGCARAKSVSASFPTCVKDVESVSCQSLVVGGRFNPPASCQAAVEVEPTAEQKKCVDLVRALCGRIIECDKTLTAMASVEEVTAACVAELADDLRCEAVTMVGSTYDGCMMQLQTRSCAMLFPMPETADLPAECNQVVQVPAAGMSVRSERVSRLRDHLLLQTPRELSPALSGVRKMIR